MTKKLSPFDFVKMINQKTAYPSDEDFSGYSQYIINKALSQFKDTLFYANELNGLTGYRLDNKMHFDFYYQGIDKGNRYSKWEKRSIEQDQKIRMLKELYNYSTYRAREMIPLVDSLDLWGDIEKALFKGGL